MNTKQRGRRRKYDETGFERWGGYMSAKISKLQEQFKDEARSKERKGIFHGIAIFVNGYTEPTSEELKRIMLSHGGTYHHYYSRTKTTHVIASNLPNAKIKSEKLDFIVSPKWITESLSAGKLLDYTNYLLYACEDSKQGKLRFEKVEKDSNDSASLNSNYSADTKFREAITNEDSSSSLYLSEGNSNTGDLSLNNGNNSDNLPKEKLPDNNGGAPRKSSLSTANPNFLSEFYNNSRLHHISTSGAMFKEYVKELQNKDDDFTGRTYLKNWMKEKGVTSVNKTQSRVIMHIDMDCFFVSVGLVSHPELKNLPVAVTHANKNSLPKRDKENFLKELQHFKRRFKTQTEDPKDENEGKENEEEESNSSNKTGSHKGVIIDERCSMAEIASCSYEARKRGIKNGMFLGVALKLCPELKTIPYDFEGYKSVSMDLYNIVASYTKNIEAVSCDEMYIDVEDVLRECCVSPLDLATCIRQQIQAKTKCPCSIGIGPNMVTARMATKKAKPNGQFLLESSEVQEFMKELPVSDLPGVGGSLRTRLEEEGVKFCKDLQRLSVNHLQMKYGQKTGRSLFELSRGIDDRPINKDHQRKSVSAEVNYGIRFENERDADKFLIELSEEVANRMAKVGVRGRTITLKLKVRAADAPVETAKFMGHGVCDNVAKSSTLVEATSDKRRIYKESVSLLKQVSVSPKELRGVGIQISKLESCSSSSLSIKDFLQSKPSADSSPNTEEVRPLPKASTGVTASVSQSKLNVTPAPKKGLDNWLHSPSVGYSAVKSERSDKVLDMEVLEALPPELREQVVEEYKAQGYVVPSSLSVNGNLDHNPLLRKEFEDLSRQKKRNIESSERNSIPGRSKEVREASPQPGPSKLIEPRSPQPGPSKGFTFDPGIMFEEQTSDTEVQEIVKPSALNKRDSDLREAEYEDISFSQIDSSFLSALPADVRIDLKRDLRKKLPKGGTPTTSPVKLNAPIQIKKKRGRPKGTTKNIHKGKLPIIKNATDTHYSGKNVDVAKSPFKKSLVEELGIIHTEEDSKSEGNSKQPPVSLPAEEPSLCGEYEMESVKNLISQWVKTCDRPAKIDISILTEYFSSLITEKDLEKLEIILKFLWRRTRSVSQDWKRGFDLILENVQRSMRKIYKAPLRFSYQSCPVQESL